MIISHLTNAIQERLAICAEKGTARDAARLFASPDIGLIVVCGMDRKVVGVVSKSDLVRHLAGNGSANSALPDLMTSTVAACNVGDDLQDTSRRMIAAHVQNLPVLDSDGRPVGTLDIRDALEAMLADERSQERMLIDYISGRGYR